MVCPSVKSTTAMLDFSASARAVAGPVPVAPRGARAITQAIAACLLAFVASCMDCCQEIVEQS